MNRRQFVDTLDTFVCEAEESEDLIVRKSALMLKSFKTTIHIGGELFDAALDTTTAILDAYQDVARKWQSRLLS